MATNKWNFNGELQENSQRVLTNIKNGEVIPYSKDKTPGIYFNKEEGTGDLFVILPEPSKLGCVYKINGRAVAGQPGDSMRLDTAITDGVAEITLHYPPGGGGGGGGGSSEGDIIADSVTTESITTKSLFFKDSNNKVIQVFSDNNAIYFNNPITLNNINCINFKNDNNSFLFKIDNNLGVLNGEVTIGDSKVSLDYLRLHVEDIENTIGTAPIEGTIIENINDNKTCIEKISEDVVDIQEVLCGTKESEGLIKIVTSTKTTLDDTLKTVSSLDTAINGDLGLIEQVNELNSTIFDQETESGTIKGLLTNFNDLQEYTSILKSEGETLSDDNSVVFHINTIEDNIQNLDNIILDKESEEGTKIPGLNSKVKTLQTEVSDLQNANQTIESTLYDDVETGSEGLSTKVSNLSTFIGDLVLPKKDPEKEETYKDLMEIVNNLLERVQILEQKVKELTPPSEEVTTPSGE